MSSSIVIPAAGPGLERISATLGARLRADYPIPSFKHLSRATREAGRQFWSQRAWSEYCALPVVSQISLKLAAASAPLEELSSVAGILHDESLHTALSVEVAERLGGYQEDVPDHLHFDAQQLAAPSSLPLVVWLVMGCCVGETVSRALIRARLKATRVPELRAIVARTLKDENIHVAYGWAAARRAVAGLSPRELRVLVPWCESALEASFRGPCTLRLEGRPRALERRLRQRVADAGLGACTPDHEDAVVEQCVAGFIVPGLRKLGIPISWPGA